MDKILNSSFYLHLEKGPEVAKRYKIIDILDGKLNYQRDGEEIALDSDCIEIGVKEITKKWLDKLYKLTLTQTKEKYYDPSYCYKGCKDKLTIKYNQMILSLCGHVNDEKIKKVFDKYSEEVIKFINKNI